jgi:hypothetical protein
MPLRSSTGTNVDDRRRFLSNAALLVLLSIHVVLVGWGASRHSPNLMEAVDLPAGLSHLEFANFELRKVNPPLVRTLASIPVAIAGAERNWSAMSDAPGARPEFAIGHNFIDANGVRSFWLFTLARWACLPFTVLGGVICHHWARDLYGEWSAGLAAALWCFDPNILGHAQTMNADVPAAAIGLAACYFFWRWMKRPTWWIAATAGAVLGLALLTRTTLMVLAPTLGLVWGIRVLCGSFRAEPERLRAAHFPQLLLIFGLALYTLNLGYGFEGSFRRLRDFAFVSHTFGGADAGPQSPGNRFRESWLAAVPLPLPKSFVEGIDLQRRDFENTDGRFRYRAVRGAIAAGGTIISMGSR